MAAAADLGGLIRHGWPARGELSTLLCELSALADADRSTFVDDLAARWSTARLRVMLVGEAKRGKSTVGNALLGRSVLPAGALPLTSVATTVRRGQPERIEVDFLDGRTVTGAADQLAGYVTESGNPHNRAGVRDVLVYLPTPFLHPSVELVDTPGVGSVLVHNTEAAESARRSVDVAVLVLGADPPITADERRLLRELNGQAARILVVLNKPAVPESAGFSFEVTPDIGWTQPVSSALRRPRPWRVLTAISRIRRRAQ